MTLYRIEIKTAQGASTVSVEQFLALPLEARLKLLLERGVRFFDERGELPVKDGMRLLREAGAASGAAAAAPATAAPEQIALKEFVALPLDARLKITMERRVRIVDEAGAEVSLKDALRLARGQYAAR